MQSFKGASKNLIVIANHEERNGKQSYSACFPARLRQSGGNVEIASVVPSLPAGRQARNDVLMEFLEIPLNYLQIFLAFCCMID